MVLEKKKPTKQKQVLLVVLIVGLAIFVPLLVLFGAATLFTYANFNSESARTDARYEVETQLYSIAGVKDAVVVEHLGGTPLTKKALDVRLFVDETPDDMTLVTMVKYAFERTWKNYAAFRPDSISVIVVKGEIPKDVQTKRSATFLSSSIDAGKTSKELKWLTGGASNGSVSASSAVLEKVFGPNGKK